MNKQTFRILSIIVLISCIGTASAIRKGSTWSHPFTYGDSLKCGVVKDKLYQIKEEGKDHHKVTYLYLRTDFPKGQEDVHVTHETYISSSIGKEVCFKESIYVGFLEALSIVTVFVLTLIIAVGLIANVFE